MSDNPRRLKTLVLGALPVLALSVLVSIDHVPGTDIDLTVPYAAEGPGPTIDTLGTAEGKQVVSVTGAKVHETSGHLNMTTVSVRSHMTLIQALERWLLSSDSLVPIEQIFPPGQTPEEVSEANTVAFNNSEAAATVAALNYLHRPLQVNVAQVMDGSAASGKLERDDVLRAVDGAPVDRPGQVREAVQAKKPGEEISLEIERKGKKQQVTVVLGEDPHNSGAPQLGVLMAASSADGITVDYNLSDIGGPSAGMIFSMAVIDKLTPESLTDGQFVAGTGTINEDGTVGPIGGIEHKVTAAHDAGAKVFLAPAANCPAALSGSHEGMDLIKVDTLGGAIDALRDRNAGRDFPRC